MRRAALTMLLTVVVGCSAACASDEPEPPPRPVLGWILGDGCASTPDQIRAGADGLAERGLRDAGYRSVFVICDADIEPPQLEDARLNEFLDDRGFDLKVVNPSDVSVQTAMRADAALPALRTAMTRHVINAEPLVFQADPAVLDQAHIDTVANSRVIAVHQDGRRTAGAPILGDPNRLSRALGEMGLAIALTNDGSADRELSVGISDVGLVGDDSVPATELWSGRRIVSADGRLSVPVASTDSALLRIG